MKKWSAMSGKRFDRPEFLKMLDSAVFLFTSSLNCQIRINVIA